MKAPDLFLMEMFQHFILFILPKIPKKKKLENETLRVTVDRVVPGYRGGNNASNQRGKFQSLHSKHHLHSEDY